MNSKINIALAEDHALFRKGLISLLREVSDINVIFDVPNGAELLKEMKNRIPDVVLMDIEMPLLNGKDTLDQIKLGYPPVKVIIISMHYDDLHINELISAGANGFLPKNCDVGKVIEAIHSVFHEEFYFDPGVSKSLANKLSQHDLDIDNPNAIPPLSVREKDILRLICQEKTNQEISDLLFLSKRTVEWHKNNLLMKTNSRNIIGLIKYALKFGILPKGFQNN